MINRLFYFSCCKICHREDKKIHYQNNKKSYIDNVNRNGKWFYDYKATLKCSKCGFNHPAALDFHHIDPATKSFVISSGKTVIKNKQKILDEIKKCIVLCSNCHRIEHSTYYNEYLKN